MSFRAPELMCGITGYLHFDRGRTASPDPVKRMADTISHRGPDKEGFYLSGNLALGHRRLSIIDLASGDQPMKSGASGVVIIFNGEIYNYVELRDELRALGHRFDTKSDTEVIIRAYEQWGMACLGKLNGMWAFALWDPRTEELFLSRDRIGEKPLFYAVYDNSLVFGSEIKAVLEYGIPAVPNLELLELYLFLTYIPTPFTFYKPIKKLRPGHYLRVSGEEISEHRYWDLPLARQDDYLRDEAFVHNRFKELLLDSVRLRMRSDVPFGAFLSGGLDSSTIVSLMSRLSPFPVETFTIGFKEKSFDESGLAHAVSQKFRTRHHLLQVVPENFESARDLVLKHFDEPFGDSSAIPTGIVSSFASRNVKMVLTGDGGDEVLSGYNSYLGLKINQAYRRLPGILQKTLTGALRTAGKFAGEDLRYKISKAIAVSLTPEPDFGKRLISKMAYTDYETIKSLTNGRAMISIEDFVSDFYKNNPAPDEFSKLMRFDFKHSLPDDFLVKVDRMSMANSIETRLPFLDHRLVEMMAMVHPDIKLKGWKTKSVLRSTFGKQLPKELLKAPKKGFAVPLREWFKADSFDRHQQEVENSRVLASPGTIKKLRDENRSGKRDNGNFIWTVMILNGFIEKHTKNG